MPAEALTRPRAVAWRLDAVAVLLFALLSVQYGWAATTLAARAPWWMDEVLALWTARAPDLPALWSALVHGAEFNPPLYDLLLHGLGRMGVTGALGLRLPSIVAGYLAALAAGAVARRHAGPAPALLAAGVVLSSGLFGYAVQARPYAIVTAAFAGAVALHDGAGGRASVRRAAAIAALLAAAIGCNFYALLLAGALGAIEVARARIDRRPPDRRVLAAIALAGASILAWWPILRAARGASAGDVGAPAYYARPTLAALGLGYGALAGWLLPPVAGLVATLPARPGAGGDRALLATALVLLAVPAGVWLFAALVSHSFAERYTLAGVIGLALLVAALAHRFGERADAVAALGLALLLVGNIGRNPGEIGKQDRRDALATIAAAPGALPIATGSGLRFLEAMEDAPPAIRRRLVFADVPGPSPDPTNRHQVLRWHAIRPGLPVIDVRRVCGPLLLFAQPGGGGTDALPGWIAAHAPLTPPSGGASLTPVRSLPCLHGGTP